MDVLKQAKLLRDISLFSMLDDSQLKLLAFTSEVYEYVAEEYLFHQDDVSDSIFVVLDGNVEILDVSGDSPVLLAVLGSGNLIGELAVLRGERRSASVKTKTRVEALKIPNDRFLKLITDNPQMALHVLSDISTKLARASTQLAKLQSNAEKIE